MTMNKSELLEALEKSAGAVRHQLAKALRPHNVTLNEARALITLEKLARAAPKEHDGYVPLSTVSESLIGEGPISRLFNELLNKNLVQKQERRDDQRQKDIRLTAAGKKILPALKKSLAPNDRAWKTEGISTSAIKQTVKTLNTITKLYQ